MVTLKTLTKFFRAKVMRGILPGSMMAVFCVLCFLGCSAPSAIPSIPKNHPANGFYQYASRSLLSDKACRDYKGSPDIPMGEIAKGERFQKTEDLAPGVFRFRENATSKNYLGIAYMKRSGFLQIPQACVWEEK